MTTPSTTAAFGDWESERNAIETARPPVSGLYCDQSQALRFRASTLRLFNRRSANDSAGADPLAPAVFILSDASTLQRQRSAAVPRASMLASGLTGLCGRIWFVPVEPVMGYWHLAPADDEELFTLVCDTLAAGELPAVVIDPRPTDGAIYFYPNGLSDPESAEYTHLHSIPVTEQEIADAINGVYLSQLVTPDQNASSIPFWADSAKCYPSSDAEKLIQAHVKSGLAARFQNYDIRQEQASQFGRTDIEIVETQGHAAGISIHHAVLELKVLRAFTKNGKPCRPKTVQWWIKRGIRQAFAYGLNKNTRIRMVCCFDMRTKDLGLACLDEFKSDASKANVWLRRWFMYHESSAYRDAQFDTITGS